jgi:hypothetical protein
MTKQQEKLKRLQSLFFKAFTASNGDSDLIQYAIIQWFNYKDEYDVPMDSPVIEQEFYRKALKESLEIKEMEMWKAL